MLNLALMDLDDTPASLSVAKEYLQNQKKSTPAWVLWKSAKDRCQACGPRRRCPQGWGWIAKRTVSISQGMKEWNKAVAKYIAAEKECRKSSNIFAKLNAIRCEFAIRNGLGSYIA